MILGQLESSARCTSKHPQEERGQAEGNSADITPNLCRGGARRYTACTTDAIEHSSMSVAAEDSRRGDIADEQ
jgi:hypothetical protein